MKKFYGSVCRFFAKYGKAMVICALVMLPQLTFAASGTSDAGVNILSDVAGSLSQTGQQLVRLVRVIAILAGFASAIMVVVNLLKQERDSVTKAIFWALGVVAAFAITAALNNALAAAGMA